MNRRVRSLIALFVLTGFTALSAESLDVQDALMGALGGTIATQTIEGRERYGVIVRYPRDFRQSVAAVSNLRVPVMGGMSQVPLGQVATVGLAQGPRPRAATACSPRETAPCGLT